MRRATEYYHRLWMPRHPRERVGGRSRRQAGSCTRRYRGNLRFVVLGTTDSRVSDLSDFTAARRNSTSQLTHDEDNTARSEPLVANAADPPGTATLGPRSSSAQARRFFPFGRTRRFEIIPTPRPATSMSEDWYFPLHSGWATSERVGGEEQAEERSQAPRLRRGGLRAPESLLTRHYSPPMGVPTIAYPPPEELHRATSAAVAATTAAVADLTNESEGVRAVEERVQ